MLSALTAKERLDADTPLLFFDCQLVDGTVEHWSSQTIAWGGIQYEGRVLRHNLFEAQLSSDNGIGGAPRLAIELANADSKLSQIERQAGFKGARLTVFAGFCDLATGAVTSDPLFVFRGIVNSPDVIAETTFRLSAMNRMSMQRSVLPEVRVQRMCPWRFPATAEQRQEAVNGQSRGRYSPLFRCGYSPDQANGVGNLNGGAPFTSCGNTRQDCEQRGMFTVDASGRQTGRFGGFEFVPATILVRGAGEKSFHASAIQDNQGRYNDFVPLIYGTQWHAPSIVFSRNDGNLTRMEVLLGMGEMQGVLKVLVNDIEIPQGQAGRNMTSTGWYNLESIGSRNGKQNPDFADGRGTPVGDPYGSMAYLSVVVPNRINGGKSLPNVKVLLQGLRLYTFDSQENFLGEQFLNNPAWVLLDVLMRSGWNLDEVDKGSFARAAAFAAELITAQDPVGGSVQLPRFQCDFALKSRRSAGEVIRAIRNASRIYLIQNASGLIEARVENTFALQHPTQGPGSNAVTTFNGGWPAYEFDGSSIARKSDGSASVRLTSKGAQDTPNRLSMEFQDSFNQYQQDSLSLADGDDADLVGQEVAGTFDAVGISTFSQAARMLLLALNRSVRGNRYIEFETSVKALGLMPGDLVTVTYPKEGLQRTPFRIVRIAPGPSFRTAVITAQIHDDAWYSDSADGITGGLGGQLNPGRGLPAPVIGSVLDADGHLQLGIEEKEIVGSDGSSLVRLDVSFVAPSGQLGSIPSPLIGLAPTTRSTGGSLAGATDYYYAISAVGADGLEGLLSFEAHARTAATTDTNAATLTDIQLPLGSMAFHVYRGNTSGQLFRIASNVTAVGSFDDTGLPFQSVLPPDPQFDHVNIYWRWELLPEARVGMHSASSIGNSTLRMPVDAYKGAAIRITRGRGAGQERSIVGNSDTEISVDVPWTLEPDATSSFAIAERGWRLGASGPASPISLEVPERVGAGLQVLARAANTSDAESADDVSPLTRWVIGQSGGIDADSDRPPAPVFGVGLSPRRGGELELTQIGFPSLVNTRSITAGTYRFHYYDEIGGAAPSNLNAPVAASDTVVNLSGSVTPGTFIQIDQEILQVTDLNLQGAVIVSRGMHQTLAADHPQTSLVYPLGEKVVIVPFVKKFFGSPASGDWKYAVDLPNVRLASAEMYVTNAFGDGPASAVKLTQTIDAGLRTLAGGQFSFQITGYLAIHTGAAPDVIVDMDRSAGDIYGILRSAPTGAGVDLQLNLIRKSETISYTRVHFDAGSSTSALVKGFGLPPLRSGDRLSLDVLGVGTTNPGSDLTLIIRL